MCCNTCVHNLLQLQVCAYHRSYYRPDNLCLIVAGQVEPGQLFQALAPIEEKILSKASEKMYSN